MVVGSSADREPVVHVSRRIIGGGLPLVVPMILICRVRAAIGIGFQDQTVPVLIQLKRRLRLVRLAIRILPIRRLLAFQSHFRVVAHV